MAIILLSLPKSNDSYARPGGGPGGERQPEAAVWPPPALVAPVAVAVESPVEKVATSEAAAGAARILAVDDDPINLQVLHGYLAAEDFDPTLASSGEEALRLLGEEIFDLVLLDVMMPRLSGYEVCRALREKHPIAELPVLFLTAKTQDSDLVTARPAPRSLCSS